MRRLNISWNAVLVIQSFFCLTNIIPGVFNLLHHRHSVGLIELAGGVVCAGITIYTYGLVRAERIARGTMPAIYTDGFYRFGVIPRRYYVDLRTGLAEPMTEQDQVQYKEKARENLVKAVNAIGGEIIDYPYVVSGPIAVKTGRFIIGFSHIFDTETQSITCYAVGTMMPYEERMASAALLLHNNPKLFYKWRDNPGNYVS